MAVDFLTTAKHEADFAGIIDDSARDGSAISGADFLAGAKPGGVLVALAFSAGGWQRATILAGEAEAILLDYPAACEIFEIEPHPLYRGRATGTAANIEALLASADRLGDEASRACLHLLLMGRLTGERAWFEAAHTPAPIYFGAVDLAVRPAPVIVDGGAHVGDTAAAALAAYPDTRALIAFEPDPSNHAQLTARFAEHPAVTVEATGLGREAGTLRFAGDRDSFSALDPQGSMSVPITALDAELAAADLIKLDVEGAESDAIAGARRLITEQAPALAIAAYHKPGDLADLVAQLAALRPDYRFQLRHHGDHDLESVLYVDCPPEGPASTCSA